MKPKISNCKWLESCHCGIICDVQKTKYCQQCDFYQMIDSGYGWCKALPEPIVVAWCKDTCSLFKWGIKP